MGLKVLHVIRGLTNSSGTTHIVIPLAEAQADLGCEVSVFHVAKPGEASLAPDPAKVRSRCFPMTVQLNNPGLSVGFARAMTAELSGFDVVHVHAVWNFPTWWAMRAAWRAGVPYLVAPQGSFDPWALGLNAWGKRVYGALTERPLLQQAARLQALTRKEAAQFARAGLRAPAVVIPNGIPARLFERGRPPPLREQLALPEGERTLLFLSRVHPKKGLDLLLRAFVHLRRRYSVTLVIAGADASSGYLDDMKGLAAELGVAEHCRFIGEVRGERKLDVLQGADAYALISRSEGLPVAAVEALGAGLPCVLSEECNLPEVAETDAGWVVPPAADAAADALADLFADPARAARCGKHARRLVAERFTWEKIARQTVDVYETIIAE